MRIRFIRNYHGRKISTCGFSGMESREDMYLAAGDQIDAFSIESTDNPQRVNLILYNGPNPDRLKGVPRDCFEIPSNPESESKWAEIAKDATRFLIEHLHANKGKTP